MSLRQNSNPPHGVHLSQHFFINYSSFIQALTLSPRRQTPTSTSTAPCAGSITLCRPADSRRCCHEVDPQQPERVATPNDTTAYFRRRVNSKIPSPVHECTCENTRFLAGGDDTKRFANESPNFAILA